MGIAVKWGVFLALLVSLVSVGLFATGLHMNPLVGGLGSIVLFVALTIVAVFWTLKQTAAENGYMKQLGSSLVLGVVGGVLIFVISWLTMTVLFPNALEEAIAANISMLQGAGLPEQQLQAQIAKIEETTVVAQSATGMIGTIVTSVVVGAVVAIFKRRK